MRINRLGFTLIELLIVIAILGILAAVTAASYSLAQKKGRDSRRQSDLKAVQNGFEQYFSDSGSYPVGDSCTFGAAYPKSTYFPSGFPADPKPSFNYSIACGINGTAYCICAQLEGTTTGGNAEDLDCTYGSGQYYCLSNLQD